MIYSKKHGERILKWCLEDSKMLKAHVDDVTTGFEEPYQVSIFQAMKSVYQKHGSVTIRSLTEELAKMGMLSDLLADIVTKVTEAKEKAQERPLKAFSLDEKIKIAQQTKEMILDSQEMSKSMLALSMRIKNLGSGENVSLTKEEMIPLMESIAIAHMLPKNFAILSDILHKNGIKVEHTMEEPKDSSKTQPRASSEPEKGNPDMSVHEFFEKLSGV